MSALNHTTLFLVYLFTYHYDATIVWSFRRSKISDNIFAFLPLKNDNIVPAQSNIVLFEDVATIIKSQKFNKKATTCTRHKARQGTVL